MAMPLRVSKIGPHIRYATAHVIISSNPKQA